MSMKRLFLCILSLAAGLAGGSTVRFTQHWQHGYRNGYIAAVGEFQREAVREGHGHWERRANSVGFSWNAVRPEYEPDRLTLIPGLE
jgi:cation transport regulator ChaB